MKIAWIRWNDAHGQTGPVSVEEVNKQGPLEMVSAGIYLGEDRRSVRLSMDFYKYFGNDTPLVRTTIIIAKKNIIDMKIFTVPDYDSR